MTIKEYPRVKAKKKHMCVWCAEIIEIGEIYFRLINVFDGNFNDSRYHLECSEASLREDFYLDQGFTPGDFKRGKTSYESWDLN